MRPFGEAVTVRIGKDGKVGNREFTTMCLGYTKKYEGNYYRMFNPLRNSGVETHTVTWRLNADFTNLDSILVIEADSPRDEDVDTQIKIEPVVEGVNGDVSVKSEVSRALSSLEQEG